MDKLYELCDEMASKGEFIKLGDVVECFCGGEIAKLEGNRVYAKLRKMLNRVQESDNCIEFKNGKDFGEGFRYKEGKEYYFENKELNRISKKKGKNEQTLFRTGGLQMLFEGDTAPTHLIELECVDRLENLNLVKVLAKYLNSKVISFKYIQGYENEMKITMHPHLLKEYNSRWFLFGYVQEDDDQWKVVNFAVDRIVYKGKNDIKADLGCKKAPKGFYENYFKDIVGVTHPTGGKMEMITIRTTDFKVHQLIKTKPIHSSQKEVRQFDLEKGQGEFTVQVIPNIELQTRLLSYGPGIYVAGDGRFPQQMRKAVSEMAEIYGPIPK